MKRTRKKVMGFFGLFIVALMTITAAVIPSPGVSALSTLTDTITVRVVGSVPNVDVAGITNGEVTISKKPPFIVNYENVGSYRVTVKYTNKDGVATSYLLDEVEVDGAVGTKNYDFTGTPVEDWGYGDYVITVTGLVGESVHDEDIVNFHYYPLEASVAEDEDTGKYFVDLEYATDEVQVEKLKVSTIKIDVLDENGKKVDSLSPIEVKSPTDKVEIPFADKKAPSGKYKLLVTAYNNGGEVLYNPVILYCNYKAIEVPDTGRMFQALNISKADYLITGLMVFFIVAILGIAIITKNSRKKTTARSKRK